MATLVRLPVRSTEAEIKLTVPSSLTLMATLDRAPQLPQ
jgi:hypothetical protein